LAFTFESFSRINPAFSAGSGHYCGAPLRFNILLPKLCFWVNTIYTPSLMMMQPHTSIEILGITITEPTTALTDFIVTAACLWAYFRLRKHNGKERVLLYFRIFFLSMALATFIGGLVGHAFLYYLRFEWKLPGWITSMISVAFLERVSIERAKPLMKRQVGYFFMRLNFIELMVFAGLAIFSLDFSFVEIHAAYGMLGVVLSFEIFTFIKTRDLSSKYLIASVGITTLAAIVHIAKFSFSKWFNFFDIGHILLAISSFLIYKSAHFMEGVSDGESPAKKEMELHLP